MRTSANLNIDINSYLAKPYKLTKGNSKIAKNVFTLSTLMGDDNYLLTDVYGNTISACGTCTGHCEGCKGSCYVAKSYRYPSVMLAHLKMTIGLRQDFTRWSSDIDKQLRRAKTVNYVRLHQSGELESAEILKAYIQFAKNNERYTFYIYTKAYELIAEYSEAIDSLPAHNLVVLISVWGRYGIQEYKALEHYEWIKAFVYINSEYTLSFYASQGLIVTTFCQAYDIKGHLDGRYSCGSGCKKCMTIFKSFKIIGCYEH